MTSLTWSKWQPSSLQWAGLIWGASGPTNNGAREKVLWHMNTPAEFTDMPDQDTRVLQSEPFPYSDIKGKHIMFQALWGRNSVSNLGVNTCLAVWLDKAINPETPIYGSISTLDYEARGCQHRWGAMAIDTTYYSELGDSTWIDNAYGNKTGTFLPSVDLTAVLPNGDESMLRWTIALRDARTDAGRIISITLVEVVAYEWL